MLAAAVLAALLVGPSATLSLPPRGLAAGQAWRATLVMRPAPRATPAVLARAAAGRVLAFRARRIGSGRYRVRLVLPREGRWRLSARVGRRTLPLRTIFVRPLPPPVSPLPGAAAFRVCGGGGAPYPQYGLALGFGSAWLACVGQRQVQRVDLASGRVVARIGLPIAPWSIAAGEDGVWAVALGGSQVYGIAPGTNRVTARISLGGSLPYLWAGAGALWVADDSARELVRVEPGTNRPSARLSVGDGPAGFVFDGSHVWVLNHREGSLDRIDPATNAVTRMASGLGPANSAPERIAFFGGALWVTGRGLDLLRLSPVNGAVLGQTEIGPAGIDVRSDGAALWVASYDAAAEPRGDPVAGSILRVAADGSVLATIVPTRRMFVNGLAASGAQLWVFDSVAGLLLRLPA
jgi:DNA-binding beta-propeller fold protein YncE